MSYALYDYVDDRGVNVIREWIRRQEKRHRAKLDAKLRILSENGPELPPHLLTGAKGFGHIKKLRVVDNVQLRLMVCEGPIPEEKAFTLLLGAIEKDFDLDPRDAYEQADSRRRIVIAHSDTRRCKHEW